MAGYAPDPMRTGLINDWRQVALYIEENDSYQTLQTAHYDNLRPFSEYYYNEDWYDFTLNQAGHGDFSISAKDFFSYRQAHPDKPFIEGECFYEFCSTLEENGTRLCTDDMVRRVAYTAMQCGACGYTYGAQGIWDCIWEKPETDGPISVFNRFGIPWYQAVDGPGAVQMGYMRRFYEENHFEEMSPIFAAAISPFGISSDESSYPTMFDPLATANVDRSRAIIYYNEHTRGGCHISGLLATSYTAWWFNPRNGQKTPAVQEFIPDSGSWDAPPRPDANDWLLVIECEK